MLKLTKVDTSQVVAGKNNNYLLKVSGSYTVDYEVYAGECIFSNGIWSIGGQDIYNPLVQEIYLIEEE